MTKTASQKARAKQQTKNNNQKGNSNQVIKNNNQVTRSIPNKVKVSGAQMMSMPSKKSYVPKTYFKVLGETTFRGRPCLKARGRDFLSSQVIAAAASPGTTQLNVVVCPMLGPFEGTRLSRFCSMYEKYLFTNMVISVDSGAGTSTNGSYLIAYDRDPSDKTPTTGDPGLREFFGMEGTQSFPIWTSGSVGFPLSDLQEFYYTSPNGSGVSDERLYAQGQFYIAVGPQQLSADTAVGVYLEYDILLFEPELGSLTSESKSAFGANYGPTGGNGTAWPIVGITSTANIGEGIYPITGGSTNSYRGYQLDPGVYLVEQLLNGVTQVRNFTAPVITALDQTKQNQVGLINYDVVASVINGAMFRSDRVTVPVGGATIFGSIDNNATAVGGGFVRILNAALKEIF